jgi:cytoskeletal protein RodZ
LPDKIEGIKTAKIAAQIKPRERMVLNPFFLPKSRIKNTKIIPKPINLFVLMYPPKNQSIPLLTKRTLSPLLTSFDVSIKNGLNDCIAVISSPFLTPAVIFASKIILSPTANEEKSSKKLSSKSSPNSLKKSSFKSSKKSKSSNVTRSTIPCTFALTVSCETS